MKIAMIDPSLFTLPYDEALCLGLERHGAQVTLYGRPVRGDERPPSLGIAYEPLFYTHTPAPAQVWEPLRLGVKAADHVVSLTRLMRHMADRCPDIIHFQWTPLPVADRHALLRLSVLAPLVMTVHDTRPFNGKASSRFQHVGAHNVYESFHRLIVHTSAGAERLQREGVPAERIACIPHGPLGVGGPAAAPSFYSDTAEPMVLLVGKIKAYKGVDILIKAVGLLPQALRRRTRFVVAGKPYVDIAPLKTLASQLGVSAQFTFDFQFLSDETLSRYLAEATLLVFPYREIEASGVLFAALQYGKPIVASRIGAFAELLEDGVHGILVPPEDPARLAQAIADLLSEPARCVRMGQAVRTLAGAIPTWEEIGERTLDVYRDTIAAWRRLPRTVRSLRPVA